ncbi:MAG: hypothetical protein ACHQ02_06105 [Candidatus Limnocylindrales bacterium]
MTARRPTLSLDPASFLRRLPAPGSDHDLELGGLLGLGIFFALIISGRELDLLPSPVRMALVLIWPLMTYAFVVSGRSWLPVGYIVIGAIALRLTELDAYGGSDALDAVWEGIGVLLSGASPYSHVYQHTQPAGQPVPYPPLMFLSHLPGYLLAGKDGVFANETFFSIATVFILVGLTMKLSWTVGLPAVAIVAASGNIVFGSADGSLESGAGVFLLLAIVAAAWAWDGGWTDRRVLIAGVAAGLPLAMKASTLFVIVLLAIAVWQMAGRRSGLRYAGSAAIVLFVISIPFLILSPVDYLVQLASVTGLHVDVYGWNVWVMAQSLGWPVPGVAEARVITVVVTLAALLLVTRYRMSSIALATLMGVLVTMVLFLSARWTTFIYYVLIEPALLAVPLLAVWAARGPSVEAPAGAAATDTAPESDGPLEPSASGASTV